MEELKAMFRVCAHIKNDGVRCNSPAMKGMNFCYQHIGGSVRELTRARSTYVGPKLDFVYPGCRQAIQHNFFVIAQAMNDGHIDLQTACAYNRIYSACERNLRRWETLYQKNAETELAPLPEEADSPDGALTQHDGGPLKPGSGLSGEQEHPSPTDVIPSAVDAEGGNEAEGPAFSQPNENAGAPSFRAVPSHERVGEQDGGSLKPGSGLSGEQTDSTPSPTNVTPTAATANTFDIQTIDLKKYDPRFKELECLYSSDPDYVDILRAAIRQIHEEEEQAWRAAGCPSLAPEPSLTADR